MPQITSPISTPSGMPAINQAHLGKAAGTLIHFATFGDFTAAITIGSSFYSADLWADGQQMTIASEADSGAVRVWRTSLAHARTVRLGRFEVVLAGNANVVLSASGAPSGGTGAIGDLSVDKATGIVYRKGTGTWASIGVVNALSTAAAAAAQAAFDATGNFGSSIPFNLKNYRGFFKPRGNQASVTEQTALNNAAYTVKFEVEAPVRRLRIWVLTREAKVSSGWKFAVAATDRWELDTLARAFSPQRAGTVYNGVADAAHAVGWHRATWGAGGLSARGGNLQASAEYAGAAQSGKVYPSTDFYPTFDTNAPDYALTDFVVSDWIECPSIAPAVTPPNGTGRHYMLLKTYKVGTEGYSTQELNGTQALAEFNKWQTLPEGRLLYGRSNTTGGDSVADPTIQGATFGAPDGSIGMSIPHIAIELEFDVPCRSFLVTGDSMVESSYSWPRDGIFGASLPSKPITLANHGMSYSRAIQYNNASDTFLHLGAGISDWLIPSHSTYDATNTEYDTDLQRAQILQKLDEADSLGIRVWIWTHFYGVALGSAAGGGSNDPEVYAYLQWIRAICASGRAVLVDIAAGWDQSTMRGGDGIHPNTTGNTYMAAAFKAAIVANT